MKFAVIPAWVQCPSCGYAVMTDVDRLESVRAARSVVFSCGYSSCVQFGKRFTMKLPQLEATPVFEAEE